VRVYRTRTTTILRAGRGPATITLVSLLLTSFGAGTAAAGTQAGPAPVKPVTPLTSLAYSHLALPGNQWAAVYSDGLAEVHRGGATKVVRLPSSGSDATIGTLPDKSSIVLDLLHSGGTTFAPQQVVVVYQAGVTATTGRTTHTNVATLNKTLSGLGIDRASKLFAGMAQSRLDSLRTTAERSLGHTLLDFGHAYVLHVTRSSVATAVARLRSSPDVAYAAPNWTVTTANTPAVPVQSAAVAAARPSAGAPALRATAPSISGVPTNFDLTSSAQSMLNRPGVDAVPAFAQIAAQGQLPGQGEIITNVSLGDLTDASAAANPSDPCNFYASNFGPTTIVQNGQRYLDWPSMPLIPTYTSDAAGALDPTGETCGQDPFLTEIGLDFSVMAPLPHGQQRPGALGSGLTDLLGIAPGASYRLVVPAGGGVVTNVDAAFLAAVNQTPRPDVITASLGFSIDQEGFSARYLEEDPMTQAIIASIVHSDGIVVCVSAGDGLRTFTNAPVPPSGGAVATDLAGGSVAPTNINDVAFSSAVSRVLDSGAIDVGGSTLNDIFSAPPNDPRNAALRAQQAFPAVRYNGARNYASGMGERVNVSAPGDNIVSFSHPFGGTAQTVQVGTEGGTSASAPETAAAAAVVLQVARLTNDHQLSNNPLAVRSFLEQTGTPLPAVPQSDLPTPVGPQIDVGNAVRTLFARHGSVMAPGVARVAVSQRRQASALGGSITTTTDPTNIPLTGRLLDALITVAPDWVGLPNGKVTYRLGAATGPGGTLATTPTARVYPSEILAAAGLPVVSSSARSIPLTYTASQDGVTLASATITLTLGPTDGTVNSVEAPIVDPVIRGATMEVSYDIHNLVGATAPTLIVSHPGRVEAATGLFFRPAFSVPLTAPSGVVNVPVSDLPGGGIYGVGIQEAPGGFASANRSLFAFTRVAPTGDAQPAPPLVAAAGQPLSHFAEPAFGSSVQVSYDVRNVSSANGAIIEVSAPGPTTFNNFNPFNNPNGSERDANGFDTGSKAYVPVHSNHGTVTLSAATLGLVPTMNQVIRVLATRNGQVTGEASGVSTVSMDGVRPADGGAVAAGFGVNNAGTDGFVTSNQVAADGTEIGSVETFSQSDQAITQTVRTSSDFYQTFNGGCAGQFAGDVGLYQDFDPQGNETDRVLSVGSGVDTGTWTPPAALNGVICAAAQQDSPDTAILSGTNGGPSLNVSTSNIAADTFSRPVSLAPALDPNAISIPGGIGQDTAANEAIVPIVDAFNPTAPGRIVTVQLGTGQVSQFPSVSTFFVSGVAIDPTTHRALIPSNTSFGIYDLSAQTGTALTVGGSIYQHPAADSAHARFLVQEVSPPGSTGTTPNNNAMSAVDVLDEQGNLVQRIAQFNFFNIFLLDMGSYLQVNPTTTTGYTLGPGGTQLAPFVYKP
jgi:hypothetical protein